jgi:FkbM family methyltransferase
MSGPAGIDWAGLAGSDKDIRFARENLPGLAYAADLARERACAVQAGANIGVFPLYLAQCFERVITFEPSINARDDFCDNAPGRLYPTIELHDAALGAEPGRGFLHAWRRNGKPGHSGTYHVTLDNVRAPGGALGGAEVAVETIDQLGLKSCGLIYLDIEGFEFYALQGAAATIEFCRPVIGVEINKNLDQLGIRPSEVINWIGKRRYRPAARYGSDWIFAPAEWGSK